MSAFIYKTKFSSRILCLFMILIFLSVYKYRCVQIHACSHAHCIQGRASDDHERVTLSGNYDYKKIRKGPQNDKEPQDEHDITESKEGTKIQEIQMDDSLEDAKNIDTSKQHQRDQPDPYQIAPDSKLNCHNLPKIRRDKNPYPLNLLDLKPHSYLPNYRNPCWYEKFPDEFLYSEHNMCKHGRGVKMFTNAAKLWRNLQANGTRQRLRCLPYFYIIGVTKSGTTELFQKITRHRMVLQGVSKEPQWWNKDRIPMAVPKDPLKDYLDMYDEPAAQIESYTIPGENGTVFHPLVTGDASAGTIWLFDAWDRLPENKGLDEPKVITAHYIHHFQPDVKSILILRNPTTRLYSDYYFFNKNERNSSSSVFHERVVKSIAMTTECLQQFSVRRCVYNTTLFRHSGMPIGAIRRSIYFPFVKDWLEVFPRDQVYIIKLEDYSKDRFKYLNDIFKFLRLGLSGANSHTDIFQNTRLGFAFHSADPIGWGSTFYANGFAADRAERISRTIIANQQKNKSPLLPETKKILDEFFAPYNRKLAALLHDDRFLWDT